MFQRNLNSGTSNFNTLVGSGATLDGDFNADGKVRIDGKIKGHVRINGDLIIGETALILGNISAGNVDLAGTVEGNMYCKGQLKLATTAKLTGDIQVKGLSIEEGAQFQGICSMSNLEKVCKVSSTLPVDSDETANRLKKKPIISRPQFKDSTNL